MNLNRREKIILSSLAMATAIGAGLLASPNADASPLSFMQGLNDNGIMVYDTTAALSTGLAICKALETTNGAVVARNLYLNFYDVRTQDEANVWVVVAVEQLCPEQDHRGNRASSEIGEAYAL